MWDRTEPGDFFLQHIYDPSVCLVCPEEPHFLQNTSEPPKTAIK